MRRTRTGWAAGVAVAAFASCTAVGVASAAVAATGTEDLADGLTPTELAQELAGAGVEVSNVRYTGTEESAGRVVQSDASVYGFTEGVVLTTGWVDGLAGPNSAFGMTQSLGTPGDQDLTALAEYDTLDASVLQFDFVPTADTVYVSYVFASEEYTEYVGSSYNDVFAFFVNGTNCAVTGSGTPVSVNTINGGDPLGSEPAHSELYRDNAQGALDTQADGLTVVLVCEADVRPGETNTMKLAIADGSDSALDSWVLLAAGGITTEAPGTAPAVPAVAAIAGVVLLGGVGAGAAISLNTPRRRQSRLLRKRVRLTPREDTTGRHASAPAVSLPAVSLAPRTGHWEHVVSGADTQGAPLPGRGPEEGRS